MLSKEDKLKYGQLLRNQIKEKEQRKKGVLMDKKQIFQRKLQTNQYAPFGKPGGGAPSIQIMQDKNKDTIGQYRNSLTQIKLKLNKNIHNDGDLAENGQQLKLNDQLKNKKTKNSNQKLSLNLAETYQQQSQQPNFIHMKNQNQYSLFPYSYIPTILNNQSYASSIKNKYNIQQPNKEGNTLIQQQKSQKFTNQKEIKEQIKQKVSTNKLQNEELVQIFKNGGRNLLKLQNETIQQLSMKQKQKNQMSKFLKYQMQEIQKRKRDEKRKREEIEILEQQKNQEYFRKQREKLLNDQRKISEKKQKLQEDNLKYYQIKKKVDEEAKKNALDNRKIVVLKNQTPKQINNHIQQPQVQMSEQQQSEYSSLLNQSIPSRQKTKANKKSIVRKKNTKLELFTQQLKKMKEQISNQGHLFQKEIIRAKKQAALAISQKKRADQQIGKLRLQLNRKLQNQNDQLYRILQKNKSAHLQSQSYNKKRLSQRAIRMSSEDEINQSISNFKTNRSSMSNSLDFSNSEKKLISISKKIPLNVVNNPQESFSMSRISDFAKGTAFYNKQPDIFGDQNNKANIYLKQIKDSIVEEDEQRVQSRRLQRKVNYKSKTIEQLDKLVESRRKSRGGWGQMSSVNSQITKQIQQLLMKRQRQFVGRPQSNLSQAGRNSLVYNNGYSLSKFSFYQDQRKDFYKNERQKLNNIGVQAINSLDQDQDLNAIDELLNKYNN